jgi:hypothetical protein
MPAAPEVPPSDPTDREGFVTIRITAFSHMKMMFISDGQFDKIVAGLKEKERDIKLQSRGWPAVYTKTKPHTAFEHLDRRVTIEIDIPEDYKFFIDSDPRNRPKDVEWIEGWDDMFKTAVKPSGEDPDKTPLMGQPAQP